MSDDIDSLRAELAQTKRLLADEKGKALAATRDRDQVRREAEKAKIEAETYRQETDQSIATAADQLKAAMAVSTGIFYLGQWGVSIMQRYENASRAIYREEKTWIGMLEALCQAVKTKNQPEIDRLIKRSEGVIAIARSNAEKLRVEIEAQAQVLAEKEIGEAFWKWIKGDFDPPKISLP